MIPFSIAGATAAIFLGMLGCLIAFLFSQSEREKLGVFYRDPVLVAGFFLVLSAIPSVLMSENITRAFFDWKSYWLFFVYFIVAFNSSHGRLREGLFWTLFCAVILSSGVAICQHYGGVDFLFIHIGAERRPGGTLYPMTLAGILYQTILLSFSILMRERKSSALFFFLTAGILIQMAALLFTLTRGAYIALIGGLLLTLLILRGKKTLLGVAVLFGIIALFLVWNPTDLDRSLSVPKLVKAQPDRNIKTRLVLWDISFQLFKEHPLFGVGMGDYSIEAEKLLEERKIKTTSDSHNIFLQILATRGLFGFVFFALFWIVLLREFFRLKNRLERGSFERHITIGAIAATIAVLVGALTENNIDDSEVFIAYLFIMGLARSAFPKIREDVVPRKKL